METKMRKTRLMITGTFCIGILIVVIVVCVLTGHQSGNPYSNILRTGDICHIYNVDLLFAGVGGVFHDRDVVGPDDVLFFECDIVLQRNGGSDHEKSLQLVVPKDIVAANAVALQNDEWFISYDPAWVANDKIMFPSHSSIISMTEAQVDARLMGTTPARKLRTSNDGTKSVTKLKTRRTVSREALEARYGKVIIVRVNGPDLQVVQDKKSLYELVLGNGTSLKTQYEACSQDALILEAYDRENPVLEFTASKNITDYYFNELFLEINPQVKNYYKVTNMGDIADHVMFVVPYGIQSPPGTRAGAELIAYAGVNHWKSMYTDSWVDSVALLLHETGHNRGLDHSWEDGIEYADTSGVMGYPIKGMDFTCYNGLHFQKLGFLLDRVITVDPMAQPNWIGDLVAFVDSKNITDGQAAIINVGEFSLVYNRAKSYDAQTHRHQDKVLIHKQHLDQANPLATDFVAALDAYTTLFNQTAYYGIGQNLYIKVCDIHQNPDRMKLGIGTDLMTLCDKVANTMSPSNQRPSQGAPSIAPSQQPLENSVSSSTIAPGFAIQVPIYEKYSSNAFQRAPGTKCDDYFNVQMYISSELGHQSCTWVSDHLLDAFNNTHTIQEALCQPTSNVYHFCEETCGKCRDNCVDEPNVFFSYLDQVHTCSWLRERQNLWTLACSRTEVNSLCRETCETCL